MPRLTYENIFEYNLKLYDFIVKEYGTDDIGWEFFKNSYIDPDGYPIGASPYNGKFQHRDEIKCTVDGLLSIKRIWHYESFGEDFIKTYEEYRRVPVIFFPRETGGINTSRSAKLEDRIDHTLLDLKNYCECKDRENSGCRLKDAYQLKNTKKWIESFGYDFTKIIEWMGINDIFTYQDEEGKCQIYDFSNPDLYTSKEKIPLKELWPEEEYCAPRDKGYVTRWGEAYYNNIKKKIKEFINNARQS